MTLQETEYDQLESMKSWHSEAPVRLVGWALRSLGGEGKSGAIKQKLAGEFVPSSTWNQWWKKVLPAVRRSSGFLVRKNNSISFWGSLDAVPAEPLASLVGTPARSGGTRAKEKAPTVASWRRWFLDQRASNCPGTYPTAPALNAIQGLKPRDDLNLVLEKTFWAAGVFLARNVRSGQGGDRWTEALARVVLRLHQVSEPGSMDAWARPMGTVLIRLAKTAGYSTDSLAWLISVGTLGSDLTRWQRGFMSGVWRGFQSPAEPQTFLSAVSSDLARSPLARALVVAALNAPRSETRRSDLDRILDTLLPRERPEVLLDLVVRAARGEVSRAATLDYVVSSRHASVPSNTELRLNLVVMASVFLSNGSGPGPGEASVQIGQALAEPDHQAAGPVWNALLLDARRQLDDLRAQHAGELESQRLSYERKLEEAQQDAAGLLEQNRTFRALMASGREESRFEIRRDMLLEIGDILQRVYRQGKNSEERLEEVKARLPIVLSEGGAEPLGTAGDLVPYDAALHHSPVTVSGGTMVRLSAPGVVLRSDSGVGRVVLKAEVSVQPEVA